MSRIRGKKGPTQSGPPFTPNPTSLLARVGVNVHLNFSGTPYTNTTEVINAMNYLGLTLMRDKGAQTNTTPYNTAAAAGMRFMFFAMANTEQLTISTHISRLVTFVTTNPGKLVVHEGPNEVNNWPIIYNGGQTLAHAKQYMQDLFAAHNANATLKDIPVANLTLAADAASDYTPLGTMLDACDMGNVHPYMSFGNQPNTQLATLTGYAQQVTPGYSMVVSESGYPTLASDTAQGVDEATQAKLTLNLIMYCYAFNIAWTVLYELVDNTASGGGAWDFGGLFRGDWTKKPAADAIHNFTTILTSTNSNPVTTQPGFTISGLTGYNNAVAVFEGSGGWDIIVWREPDIWNQTTHAPITASLETCTISLTSPVGGYDVYDPIVGTAIQSQGTTQTSSIQVSVRDHPIIVRLHPVSGGGGGSYPAGIQGSSAQALKWQAVWNLRTTAGLSGSVSHITSANGNVPGWGATNGANFSESPTGTWSVSNTKWDNRQVLTRGTGTMTNCEINAVFTNNSRNMFIGYMGAVTSQTHNNCYFNGNGLVYAAAGGGAAAHVNDGANVTLATFNSCKFDHAPLCNFKSLGVENVFNDCFFGTFLHDPIDLPPPNNSHGECLFLGSGINRFTRCLIDSSAIDTDPLSKFTTAIVYVEADPLGNVTVYFTDCIIRGAQVQGASGLPSPIGLAGKNGMVVTAYFQNCAIEKGTSAYIITQAEFNGGAVNCVDLGGNIDLDTGAALTIGNNGV